MSDTISVLYRQVLGRDADPDGRAHFQAEFDAGASIETVRHELAYSAEAAVDISWKFTDELGRAATAGDIDFWQYQLSMAYTTQDYMRVGFAHSGDAGAAIATDYQQVVGYTPTSNQVTFWEDNVLAQGGTLSQIRYTLATSAEAYNAIDSLYHQVLGRGVDPIGAASFEGQLAAAGTSLADVRHGLAYSAEAAGYIDAIYRQVAGRPATAGEIALFQTALNQGGDWNLSSVRWNIAHSFDAANAVNGLYQSIENRNAGQPDFDWAEANLGLGATLDSLRPALAHSSEAAAAIAMLYQQVLGRAPIPAEITVYEDGALAVGNSLGDVRYSLAHSPEAVSNINTVLHDVANRTAQQSDIDYWTNAFNLGVPLAGFRSAIAQAEAPAQINAIYTQMLGHASNDPGLLATYVDNLGSDTARWTLDNVRYDLAHRPEAAADITAIFQQMLGRTPSTAEIAVYEDGALSIGNSVDQVRYAVEYSPEARKDFDAAYYLAQNPDVAASGMDPYLHYITTGWKEGRNPSALFNTNYYLQQNPDVAAAGVNPLLHYRVNGWREGRDPSADFNTRAYLAAYPDVAAAGIDPLAHYMDHGIYEGRSKFAATPDNTLVLQAAAIDTFYYSVFGRAAFPNERGNIEIAFRNGESLESQFASLRPTFAMSPSEIEAINGFYNHYYHRNANTDELTNIKNAVAAGQSFLTIEQALQPSSSPAPSQDAVTAAANAFYQQVFGCDATAQDIGTIRAAIAAGQTIQQIDDFFRPIFVYSDIEDAFLKSAYNQVTGHDADSNTILAAEDAIYGGASFADIRYAFAHSSATNQDIDSTYRAVLGRGVTSSEILDRENELSGNGSMAGMRAGLAHTNEAAAEIDKIYWDLFGHGVDATSLAVIEQQIADGMQLSDFRKTLALDPNNTNITAEINAAYQGAVGQNASSTEIAYWRGRLANGLSKAEMDSTISTYAGVTLVGTDGDTQNYQRNIDLYENLSYDPATDKVAGYASPYTNITLIGADGATIAVSAARDLLAELPVYITLYSGQTPSIVLADGRSVTFDNGIQLANYLMRTAQHTADYDPLLATAYAAAATWMDQVDQPALQAGISMAALYHYDSLAGRPGQALLAQTASGLFFQLAAMDPSNRPSTLSSTIQVDGHQTTVTVGTNGTVNFHDIDPGIFGTVLAAVGILTDILAIIQPEIGIPLAVAVSLAEAGYAFSNGNTLGGILSLASAVAGGLGFAGLSEAAEVISIARAVVGGVYGIVSGAEHGDVAAILGGALQVAGAAAAGFGGGSSSDEVGDTFDGPGIETDADLNADTSHSTFFTVNRVISAAGALTSFGSQLSKGDIQGALLYSLGPWLSGLAAANVASGVVGNSIFDGPGMESGPEGSYPQIDASGASHTTQYAGNFDQTDQYQVASATAVAQTGYQMVRFAVPAGVDLVEWLAGRAFIAADALAGTGAALAGPAAIASIFVATPTGAPSSQILPDGTTVTSSGDTTRVSIFFTKNNGVVQLDTDGVYRSTDGTVVGVAVEKDIYGSLTTLGGREVVGSVSERGLTFDSEFLNRAKTGDIVFNDANAEGNGSTSTGSSQAKPVYTPNPAHTPIPGSPGQAINPNKDPEPTDAEAVYQNAKPREDGRAYYGKSADGKWYQYRPDNAGGAHYAGTVPKERVPNYIRNPK